MWREISQISPNNFQALVWLNLPWTNIRMQLNANESHNQNLYFFSQEIIKIYYQSRTFMKLLAYMYKHISVCDRSVTDSRINVFSSRVCRSEMDFSWADAGSEWHKVLWVTLSHALMCVHAMTSLHFSDRWLVKGDKFSPGKLHTTTLLHDCMYDH